ncbi:MAG: sugar ABC transporter permease [Bacillota bacterium]
MSAQRRRRLLRLSLSQQRAVEGLIFISPWIAGFTAFALWPLLRSFLLSFQKLEQLVGFKTSWAGMDNFREAFLIDARFVPMFLDVVRNTLIDIPAVLVFSLFTALMVNLKLRGDGFFRAVFFLPVVIGSGAVVQQLQNQEVGRLSIVRSIEGFGTFLVTYLGPAPAMAVLDLLNRLALVLWGTGVQVLLFLAGLQSISPMLYEAARVDGATDWEMFWKITLPMLSPIILVVTIYTLVDSFTSVFNPILMYVRDTAFSGQFRMGYAAAMGWIYFAFVFILMVIVFKAAERHVFYAGERSQS